MKRAFYFIFCLCSIPVIVCCTKQSDAVNKRTNTIQIEKRIYEIYEQRPDQALSVIDTALNSEQIAPFQADYLRALIFSSDNATSDSARILLENLLEHDSIINNPDRKAKVLTQLVELSRNRDNNEHVLKWGTQLLELNKERGDNISMLSNQVEIGTTLTYLGRTEEGMTKIDDAIRQLDHIQQFAALDACLKAMKRKIQLMNKQNNFIGLVSLAQRMALKVSDFKDHPQKYYDGTPHIPTTKDEIQFYCSTFMARSYAYLAYGYASIGAQAEGLVKVKNMEMSRKYATLFEQMNYGHTCNGRKLICSAWFKLGEYDKMLAIYEEQKQKWGDDTLHADYATMLFRLSHVAYFRSEYHESFNYWNRYIQLNNLLQAKANQSTAQKYAAQYREQEQELALQKTENELARKNVILFVILMFVAFSTLISFYFYRVRLRISEKNHALVKIINELQDTKKDTKQEANKGHSCKDKLFDEIDHYIREQRLYTDPNLQRQDILDHFSINKNMLNALFNEHNDGLSFPAYINNLRLEEGQHMLRNNPEKNITDIATAIGFTAPNFREQFKKKYGITPTEFRQSL